MIMDPLGFVLGQMLCITTWVDPEKFVRGSLKRFCSHQHISQRVVRTSLQKQLDLRGPIASQGGS